ncbi:MAG: hypothetical protein JNK26_05025, partial [Candidatus Doudnabacteria bacterium]|nr:hypothetical protein [Candidatus Doudnabacteria bacterium]
MQPTSATEILTIALMHEPAPERVSRFKMILRPHFIDPEIETKDLSAMERCVRMALHIREGIRMVETQYGRLVLTSNAKLQGEKITKVFRQFVADLLCWYLTFSIEDRRLQGVLVEY